MRRIGIYAAIATAFLLTFLAIQWQLVRFRNRIVAALPGMIYTAILKERSKVYGYEAND